MTHFYPLDREKTPFKDVATFQADGDVISIIGNPGEIVRISQKMKELELNSFTNLGV